MKSFNIYKDLPKAYHKEFVNTILKKNNIKIEVIASFGYSSPVNFWYNQKRDEFVLLLKGEAEILFKDNRIKLKEGDYMTIPAFKKHRVSFVSKDAIWLCIFFD